MITILNLSFSYKKPKLKSILRDLTIEIKDGEFIAIVGPSGCGKTTFLKIIANLINEYSGEILIDGKTPGQFSKTGRLAYFFQEANLFPWRTVEQNVKLPLEIKKKIQQTKIDEVIKLVGLEEYKHFYPKYISGGMRQKTALARGLVFDPLVLCMDEPFANLDEITKEILEEELLSIWEQDKKTIFFVTHSISEAIFLSDRVIVFDGKGKIEQILNNPIKRPRNKRTRKSRDFFILSNRLRELLQRG